MKLIKIEYYYNGEGEPTTFELFNSIEKAFDFFKSIKFFGGISLVDVNPKNIYFEENGELNYEDNSELFL